VVARQHTTATHIGEFLGIPATGRRIHWDAITMVRVEDGRVIGQWAQPDLFAIYRQISDAQIPAAPLAAARENAPDWAYRRPVPA
jgi:SnoaL-like polyketide cyclase